MVVVVEEGNSMEMNPSARFVDSADETWAEKAEGTEVKNWEEEDACRMDWLDDEVDDDVLPGASDGDSVVWDYCFV